MTNVTPLHLAANNGNIEAIRVLIEAGANIEAQNVIQLTPLHLAAINGHIRSNQRLIAAHANIEAQRH